MIAAVIETMPLWLVLLVLVAGFVGMAELGFAVHRRIDRRGRTGDSNDEAQVLSTALLLLALLLGFTFSMALGRYDERRALVVQEANDIGTAWLRAGLYETPAGAALQGRLADYARTRVGSPDRSAAQRLAAGERLRGEIWRLTRDTIRPAPDTARAAALVAAVNAVLDTATMRERAVEAHVPPTVLALLVVYALVAMFLLGYVLAAFGSRHRLATTILMGLLGMTIVLILDLDRPHGGTIRISQQAMIDLVAQIGTPR